MKLIERYSKREPPDCHKTTTWV